MRVSRCNRLRPTLGQSLPQFAVPAFIDSAFVKPRADMSDKDAVKQMASDMREAGLRAGGVSRDDLALLGFSFDQIDRLATKASHEAQRLAGATVQVA